MDNRTVKNHEQQKIVKCIMDKLQKKLENSQTPDFSSTNVAYYDPLITPETRQEQEKREKKRKQAEQDGFEFIEKPITVGDNIQKTKNESTGLTSLEKVKGANK